MTQEEIIGRNITLRWYKKQYSQMELANKIGFSQKEVSRYESGRIKRMNYNFLKAVADALECEINDLEDEEYVKMPRCEKND